MVSLEREFQRAHPEALLERPAGEAPLVQARRLNVPTVGEDDVSRARAFLARWSSVFGLHELKLKHARTTRMKTRRFVRFDLLFEGLPVVGRQIVATLDTEGTLLRVTSDVIPMMALREASLRPEQAREQAAKRLGITVSPSAPTRAAVSAERGGTHRVWLIEIPGRTVKIDAHTGELRGMIQRVHP